jgi:divalent metal cation (Fe/Co/Zn/Cd) transporter
VCFAIGAASLTGGEVATALLVMVVGAAIGWEAARENLDDRRVAQWAALGILIALVLCLVGLGASYETIYCNNRDCEPLFD